VTGAPSTDLVVSALADGAWSLLVATVGLMTKIVLEPVIFEANAREELSLTPTEDAWMSGLGGVGSVFPLSPAWPGAS